MRRSLLFFALLSFATVAVAQTQPDWNYQGNTGTLVWGKLSPAYRACSKGRQQSPVDLGKARLDTALKPIEFHFLTGPVTVTNTGRAIVVTVAPGSYIVADGVRYDVVSFEFHHPSEHTFHNDFTDMEVDLTLHSTAGKTAMLAIRLSEGQDFPNATLAMLWEHLPQNSGQSEKVTDMVNPGGLLPPNRGYWTYMGSLLEPPCTEGVRWFVMQQPVGVSRHQINTFIDLYNMNTRPTQSLHSRKIQASE